MNNYRHNFILFSIAIGILVVFAGGYWWWYTSVQVLRRNVATLEADVHAKRILLAQITTESATLTSLTNDETTMNKYIISDSTVVTFLNVLEAIGRATGAAVSVVSVFPKTQTTHPMLTVSVTISGSFASVMNTIGAIETMPYYIMTSMIPINTHKPTSNQEYIKNPQWTANVSFLVGSTIIRTTP